MKFQYDLFGYLRQKICNLHKYLLETNLNPIDFLSILNIVKY